MRSKFKSIFSAIAVAVFIAACATNPAESEEHKKLVAEHEEMEAEHARLEAEHADMEKIHTEMMLNHESMGGESDSLHMAIE